jgi:pilus assembly protein CpaB
MNRSRIFIFLGIVLLLGALAIILIQQGGGGTGGGTPAVQTPQPTPEPPMTEIVVAVNDIPRGRIIGQKDYVVLRKTPDNNLPPKDLLFTRLEDVIGKRARTDIFNGQPVLRTMVTDDPQNLAAIGNDASLFIPSGKVAIAFPIDQITSVGYAVGAGDRVDMLVSFSILDVNQEGQYPVIPFNRDLQDELVAAGMPNADAVAKVLAEQASAKVQPRLVSQLTLQNIEVMHVGAWPADGRLPRGMPTLPADQSAATPQAGGTPVPTPPRPNMLILLVDQQQALIVQWLRESNVTVNLALRGAGDNAPVSTDSVSYAYILTNFNITIPPKVNSVIAPKPAGAP